MEQSEWRKAWDTYLLVASLTTTYLLPEISQPIMDKFFQSYNLKFHLLQAAARFTGQGSSLKCLLVGDGGTGKSSWINKLDLCLPPGYCSTARYSVKHATVETPFGPVLFKVWDTAGQEKFGGLRDGYYIQGQCAIIMFAVTSRLTYKNVPLWHRDVTRVCGKIPIVLVGTRCHLTGNDRKVQPRNITFPGKKQIPYVEISSQTGENIEEPLRILSRLLLGLPIKLRPKPDDEDDF